MLRRTGRISSDITSRWSRLFVAIGGTSYAAATVGSAEIRNNSVRGKDIRQHDLR